MEDIQTHIGKAGVGWSVFSVEKLQSPGISECLCCTLEQGGRVTAPSWTEGQV